MTREIKSRIWDGEKMIYDANAGYTIYLNGAISYKGQWVTNEVVLMQYTGLLGKHGKEMYEGDIVICFNETTNDYVTGSIEWDTEGADYNVMSYGKCAFGFGTGGYVYEVIGNIYENPELIEE